MPAQPHLRGASRGLRRLVVLGLVDVVLVGSLLLWPAAHPPASGLLFPRAAADPGAILELRRPGEPALTLTGLSQRPTIASAGTGRAATPEPLAHDAEVALRAALTALEPRRRLHTARPEYGLAPPAAELVVRPSASAPAITLALGNLTPLGDGRYARDQRGVLVVDRELSDAFLIPLAHLRDARIFSLDPAQPLSVAVTSPAGRLVLERAPDGRTWVTSPPLGRRRAAPEAASRLLAVLSLLETAPDATPPADSTGAVTLLSIQTGPRTLHLLDLPCTTIDGLHAHSTINLINTTPEARTTACLLGETAHALRDLADADYSDPGLVPVAAAEVARIDLTAGPDSLALQRKGGGFSWLKPAPPFAPDAAALESWLNALAAAGSSSGSSSVVPLPAGAPRAELALTLRTGAVLTLRLHTRAPMLGARAHAGVHERVLVQRDEEAFALEVDGEAAWFSADPLRFRDRQLVAVNPTDVRGVTRRMRGGSAALTRAPGDGELLLDGGPAGPGAAALVDTLAGLRATGWSRLPPAGPAPARPRTPAAEFEVGVEELSRHQELTLALGPTRADGTCVGWWTGQRADDAGFELAPGVCAVLLGELSGN